MAISSFQCEKPKLFSINGIDEMWTVRVWGSMKDGEEAWTKEMERFCVQLAKGLMFT